MKKAFKKIFIVLFTVVVILVGTAPISSAESKYLIFKEKYVELLR